jgi:hypothetical protein
MAEKQVFSEYSLHSPGLMKLSFNWTGNNQVVPPNKMLDITALTLNYIPQGSGTVGEVDVTGRDSNNGAVWRLQILTSRERQNAPSALSACIEARGGWVCRSQFSDRQRHCLRKREREAGGRIAS